MIKINVMEMVGGRRRGWWRIVDGESRKELGLQRRLVRREMTS